MFFLSTYATLQCGCEPPKTSYLRFQGMPRGPILGVLDSASAQSLLPHRLLWPWPWKWRLRVAEGLVFVNAGVSSPSYVSLWANHLRAPAYLVFVERGERFGGIFLCMSQSAICLYINTSRSSIIFCIVKHQQLALLLIPKRLLDH